MAFTLSRKYVFEATNSTWGYTFPFPIHTKYIPNGNIDRETERIIYIKVYEQKINLDREKVSIVRGIYGEL